MGVGWARVASVCSRGEARWRVDAWGWALDGSVVVHDYAIPPSCIFTCEDGAEEHRVVMNDNSASPAKRLRKVVAPDEEKEEEQSDDTDAAFGSEKPLA